MEEQESFTLPERPPQYFLDHDPNTLQLPSIPNTILPPVHHERTLPPISSLTQESDHHFRSKEKSDHSHPPITQRRTEEPPQFWPSANPLAAYYQSSASHVSPPSKTSASADSPNAMDLDTDSRGRRGGSVLSMDDPDVRMAAEALGDLRADFIASPPQQHNNLPTSDPSFFQHGQTQPEPLLSLLTTSHPFIGKTIGGSISAYSASKNYSPRFKTGAEYVERGLVPVVNTVGSVGRVTGVEGGVRWFLEGRQPSHRQPRDVESSNEGSNKRRKVNDHEDLEMDRNISRDPYAVYRNESLIRRERRTSQVSAADSLPAYDDQRSPSYEAQALIPTTQQSGDPQSPGSTWQSRLILSTSGLSIAMSDESLRSLKYCLNWLRWANEHIGKVIAALQRVLEQYDEQNRPQLPVCENGETMAVTVRDDTAELNAKIAALKSDVLKTLKEVVDVVSKYAGGALPENARILVRRHLTSLPQRFKLANNGNGEKNGEAATKELQVKEGANRVMVLAKEGLDMMAQVSGVLDGTIVSAEEWCEKLRRGKRGSDGREREGGVEVEREKEEVEGSECWVESV